MLKLFGQLRAKRKVAPLLDRLKDGELDKLISYNGIDEVIERIYKKFEDKIDWISEGYDRLEVYKDDNYEFIIAAWKFEEQTSPHNHGGSHCFFRVLEGELEERLFSPDEQEGKWNFNKSYTIKSGESRIIKRESLIHQVCCKSSRAVSFHIYSPPIDLQKGLM